MHKNNKIHDYIDDQLLPTLSLKAECESTEKSREVERGWGVEWKYPPMRRRLCSVHPSQRILLNSQVKNAGF